MQIGQSRPHPEQGFRACLGIVRLVAPYSVQRLEAAAERAIEIGARTYGSIKFILDNNLDWRPAPTRAADGTPTLHAHIRRPRSDATMRRRAGSGTLDRTISGFFA